MKIITAPNPILSLEAKPVEKIDSRIQELIKEMKEALTQASDPEGVGLAAPQIGQSYRIFIAKPSPKDKIMVFINPEIVKITPRSKTFTKKRKVGKKKKQVQKLEGCLSLKDIWGTVLRSPKLTLTYLDEEGKLQTKEFKDFLATIIQHEYDHLNGVLFPKRVLEQKGKLYKSSKDEEGDDVFEELEL
ncbi:MAG TPA: peptide deformylase [Patescibacteria group bacterium]|nr:peptide deformylase [Patescibacteria group bacterium]